jgi:hypothetical protein
MMLTTLENWNLPLDEFFNTLEQQLRTQLEGLFHNHFSRWAGTALYSSALKIVKEMLNLNLHQQRIPMASESLDDEEASLGPFIFHFDVFRSEKKTVMQVYCNGATRG